MDFDRVRSLKFNDIRADGAKALGGALKTNMALQNLEYAEPPFSCCQQPLTLQFDSRCSLDGNYIGAEGAKALSKALKVNKALETLKYAAAH